MRSALGLLWTVAIGGVFGMLAAVVGAQEMPKHASHPPIRPLPVPSARPMEKGPPYFVDAVRGDDAKAGSQEGPWKTISHALKNLKPGDTLYLRGGTYHECVSVALVGAPDKPITIRSYPNELAVIDGGLREFAEEPEKCWKPFPAGAEGEFRSVKTYQVPDARADSVNVMGYFADSMVPLHG